MHQLTAFSSPRAGSHPPQARVPDHHGATRLHSCVGFPETKGHVHGKAWCSPREPVIRQSVLAQRGEMPDGAVNLSSSQHTQATWNQTISAQTVGHKLLINIVWKNTLRALLYPLRARTSVAHPNSPSTTVECEESSSTFRGLRP